MLIRILYETLASAPYPAFRNGTAFCSWPVHTLCCHCVGTYLTGVDNNRTFTSIFCTGNRLTNTVRMSRMAIDIDIFVLSTSSECTYRTGIATTKDTVKDIAATHRDIGVAEHITSTTTAIDATITDSNLFCTFSNWSISPFTSLIGTDINRGITFVGNLLATCYIGILTTTEDITGNVSTFGVMRIGAVNCNSCRNILTTCCGNRVT